MHNSRDQGCAWAQIDDAESATSAAFATDAVTKSAIALAVEKGVAGKIDADTAGKQDSLPLCHACNALLSKVALR